MKLLDITRMALVATGFLSAAGPLLADLPGAVNVTKYTAPPKCTLPVTPYTRFIGSSKAPLSSAKCRLPVTPCYPVFYPYPTYYGGSFYYSNSYAGQATPSKPTTILSSPPVGKTVQRSAPATFTVEVPTDDAEVWIQGQRMKQTGKFRRFETPVLALGVTYAYTIEASWLEGGRRVRFVQELRVKAGHTASVLFASDNPAFR
ncbi:MAG: hypothetical protein KatS3mg105_1551 [Gemmatales bacterium]|nr:MAG: hypothetical protein KatS3mg105_1551 [Gemmatales bacterium]